MNKKAFGIGLLICLSAAVAGFALWKGSSGPVGTTTKAVGSDALSGKTESLGSTPIVLDFFAQWCGPCKAEAPIIEAESKQWEGKATFVKVDVDQETTLARKFQIHAIPTIVVFKPKSNEAIMHTGFLDQARLHQFLETAINSQ